MVGRIDIEKTLQLQPNKECLFVSVATILNELVDAVNSIVSVQEKLIDSRFVVETKHEEPADPYAEQRKWIGCLVEYGNADDGFSYGILTNIEPRYSAYPFEIDNGRDATSDCWLPSKTIFYKGGDNE